MGLKTTKRPKQSVLVSFNKLCIAVFLGFSLPVCIVFQITLTTREHIMYISSPWKDWMDTKMLTLPANPNVTYAVIQDDTEYPEWNPSRLRTLIESPTSRCRRLANIGGELKCLVGRSILMDGNKYVCFDNDVRPVPGNCLIYSFGVGGDTSWDEAMVDINCSVYAFDMTSNVLNTALMNGFHFMKLQLGNENADTKLTIAAADDDEKDPLVVDVFMRSLDTIRDILGHQHRTIDILKMDIEYSEWPVFEDIFSNPEKISILREVKQIALEIHLRDFKNSSAAERVAGGRRFEQILQNLNDHGFRLVHSELNTAAQVFAEVRGQVFPLYRELLLVHRP